jgi:hypothetical protein
MSIEEFDLRIDLIRHVVTRMEDGVHYGIIPGTHDKSLWEPGAEFLRAAFNIAWSWELLEKLEDYHGHEFRYTFHAFQLLGAGVRGPGWVATAWSKERKFWCKGGRAEDACPRDCLGNHGPKGMEAQMLPHNVQDRALKRAFVAMIRNLTGTSGYFKTQEGEDDDVVAPPRTVNGTSTGDPSRSSAPSGNRHPWLVTCPEHDVKWFQTGNMREPAHRVGSEWCNLSKTVGPMVDNSRSRLLAERGMSGAGFTAWLKATYQAAWSGLKIDQRLDALETFAQEHPREREQYDADDPEERRDITPPVGDVWQPGDPLPDRVNDRDQLLRIVEAHDWDRAALENQICGGSLESYLTRHQVSHLYDLWRKMSGT